MELWDTDRVLLGEPLEGTNEEPSKTTFLIRLVVGAGLLYAAVLIVFSLDARADVLPTWRFVIAEDPITAYDCGTRISVCHNSGSKLPWHCYCPKRRFQ